MRRMLLGLVVVALAVVPAIASPSYTPSWVRGDAGSTYEEWTFDTQAGNPAAIAPDAVNNPYGNPAAKLSGDLQYFGNIDGHLGVWHAGLGSADELSVTLTIPNNGVIDKYKEVWAEVVYKIVMESGDIYPTFDFTPGYTTVTTLSHTSTSLANNWSRDVWHWQLTPNPSSEVICFVMTGTGGSVDSILVDTMCAATVPAPAALLLGGIGAGLVGWLRRRKTV